MFDRTPDRIKALALINSAMERGRISPQEGAELATFTTKYADLALPERVVLHQCLLELSGRDMSDIRPPIIGGQQ